MGVVGFKRDGRISVDHREALRGFASELGGDIRKLASDLELSILEVLLPDDISAVLVKSEKLGGRSGYCVAVNRQHPLTRQRFSIAHEIGHFVLHKNDPDFDPITNLESLCEVVPFDPGSGNSTRSSLMGNPRLEAEANKFARVLLVPDGAVKRSASYRRWSIGSLAKECKVNIRTVQVRLPEIHRGESSAS